MTPTIPEEVVERMKRVLEPYLHEHLTPQARDDAARAALAAIGPDYAVVPVEPTRAMSQAFWAKQLPGETDMFTWFKAAWPEALRARSTQERG